MKAEQTIQCVGFIMDGKTDRFAKERGEDSFSGHEAGLKKFHEVCQWIEAEAIPHAVFYAFSTENWRREEKEVSYLMKLCLKLSLEILEKINQGEKKFKIRFIGRREDLSPELITVVEKVESETSKYEAKTTIWIALSYGGRAEIVSGVNEAIQRGEKVDETTFKQLLWSRSMPDPDLVIRTGGDNRLSNFMTWGSVYSELFFSDTYWPAFTKDEFERILSLYDKRERRHGK